MDSIFLRAWEHDWLVIKLSRTSVVLDICDNALYLYPFLVPLWHPSLSSVLSPPEMIGYYCGAGTPPIRRYYRDNKGSAAFQYKYAHILSVR